MTLHLGKQLAVFLFGASISQAERNVPMRACIDDRPWIPFTNPDFEHPGQMQELIAASTSDLPLGVAISALPWKRCLEATRSGKMDAVVGAAFVPFIQTLARFPMVHEDVDTRRSLGTARVMLVRRRGTNVSWDGKTFLNNTKEVAVAMGTQIMITTVVNAGAKADDGGRTDDQNLKKLLQGRVDLMAAYEEDLKILIEQKYKGRVEIIPVPLVETHYYLAFSKAFYANNQDLVEKIWAKIGKLRSHYKFGLGESS